MPYGARDMPRGAYRMGHVPWGLLQGACGTWNDGAWAMPYGAWEMPRGECGMGHANGARYSGLAAWGMAHAAWAQGHWAMPDTAWGMGDGPCGLNARRKPHDGAWVMDYMARGMWNMGDGLYGTPRGPIRSSI